MIVELPPTRCRFEKLLIFTTACIYRIWESLHFRMRLWICIDQTLESAHSSFIEFSKKKADQKADFLRRIADNLEKHRNSVIEIAKQETSLELARLEGECSRTIDQIRLFATLAEREEWKEMSTEVAEPNRTPIPKPRCSRRIIQSGQLFIGARNFPLQSQLLVPIQPVHLQ